MSKDSLAFLSLGANLGNRFESLQKAIDQLAQEPQISHIAPSRVYETLPISPVAQPKFLNACVQLVTTLSPMELLSVTMKIEEILGKRPKPKEHPRPIDIDILFYDDLLLSSDSFTIPHPHWRERLFVLIPLRDLIEWVPTDPTLSLSNLIINFSESERLGIIVIDRKLIPLPYDANSHCSLSSW